MLREMEAAGSQKEAEAQGLLEALKERAQRAQDSQEARLAGLADLNSALAGRLRASEEALGLLQAERLRLLRALGEARESPLLTAELTRQLAHSHAARESLLLGDGGD